MNRNGSCRADKSDCSVGATIGPKAQVVCLDVWHSGFVQHWLISSQEAYLGYINLLLLNLSLEERLITLIIIA